MDFKILGFENNSGCDFELVEKKTLSPNQIKSVIKHEPIVKS